MASASPPHGAGYTAGMRALHWATAALLVGSYASAWTVSLGDVPALQRVAARANVVGLYTLLVLQPLLGLTASMLHGDRLVLLGGLVVPDLLPVDRKLAHVMFQVHGIVALLLLGSIGMHAAAALYHHVVRYDDVLAGMLPGLMRRGGAPSPALLHRGRRL